MSEERDYWKRRLWMIIYGRHPRRLKRWVKHMEGSMSNERKSVDLEKWHAETLGGQVIPKGSVEGACQDLEGGTFQIIHHSGPVGTTERVREGGQEEMKYYSSPGWIHMGSPFEIEADDDSGRFRQDGLEICSDELAVEAHRKECGCPWPEVDYQNAVMSWLDHRADHWRCAADDVSKLVAVVQHRHLFLQNLPDAFSLTSRIMDLALKEGLGDTLQSMTGVMNLLKKVSALKSEGRLSPYQFGEPEGWVRCGACFAMVPPDKNHCTRCSAGKRIEG